MSALPIWVQAATAFATPIIALGVAYIAYQQWQTARQKLVLDLFEKRFAVFMDVRRVASEATQLGKLADIGLPNEIVARGRFLFGPEVVDDLKKLHLACIELEVKDPKAVGAINQVFERLQASMGPYLQLAQKL